MAVPTKQTITSSKSLIEILEKSVQYIQYVIDIVPVSLLLTLNIFHIFFQTCYW